MPLFEYACWRCDNKFEKLFKQSGTSWAYAECPMCGRLAPKVLSAPSFKIKGYSERNGYSNSTKEK